MCGGTPFGTELLLVSTLRDLLFIDGRESDSQIADRFVHGCKNALGQIEDQQLPFPQVASEVASIYAEAAFALGYFSPCRLLSRDEMALVRSALTPDFMSRDWDMNQLYETLGLPSHEILGWDTTVACYGCIEREMKWVFCDLARWPPGAPISVDSLLPVEILRDVRHELSNKMHLLPFGKRWIEVAGAARPPV